MTALFVSTPRGPRRGPLPALLLALVACASTGGRGCRPDDDTTTSSPTSPTSGPATGVTTGVTTGVGTAGDIDDADIAELDRRISGVLGQVYGQARRTGWRRDVGPGSVVFTLEYGLGRAHSRAAMTPLQAGLTGQSFVVDRVLDDADVTTVFASRDGFPVIVSVDVGSTSCVVSVERAGP